MKPRDIFSREDASRMATTLMEMGFHPSVVRRRLAERGIHWEYTYRTAAGGAAPQGLRQRLRNLRRQGLGLCTACRERSFVLGSSVNLCPSCLEAKWSGPAPMDRPSIAPLHVR